MVRKMFTVEEQRKIIEAVRRGNIPKLGEFIENFTPYIIKKCKNVFSPKDNINFEEVKHECSVEIFKSISAIRGKSFGELCNYTIGIIDNTIARLLKKHIEKKNRQIYMGDLVDTYHYEKHTDLCYCLEDEVVNKMLDIEAYNRFINGKLPKSQQRAIEIFFSTHGDVKEHLRNMDIKFETFRKNLNRGMNRVRQIVDAEAFRKFYSATMIFISIICKLSLDLDIFCIEEF